MTKKEYSDMARKGGLKSSLSKKKKKEMYLCHDCKKDPGLIYMVMPEIWNKYGLGKDTALVKKDGKILGVYEKTPSGFLCIPCLEKRMGRKLIKEDLLLAPCNIYNPYTQKIMGITLEIR